MFTLTSSFNIQLCCFQALQQVQTVSKMNLLLAASCGNQRMLLTSWPLEFPPLLLTFLLNVLESDIAMILQTSSLWSCSCLEQAGTTEQGWHCLGPIFTDPKPVSLLLYPISISIVRIVPSHVLFLTLYTEL